jgi:hypothetical protein
MSRSAIVFLVVTLLATRPTLADVEVQLPNVNHLER